MRLLDTERLVLDLFPGEVVVRCGDPEKSSPVRPAELALVAKAVEKRRLEFAQGRECARSALGELGVPPIDILVGADREPIWPDGFVGSLTHTDGFCAAAVARRRDFAGIGLDAEPDVPLEANVAERVSSDEEVSRAALVLKSDAGTAAHLIFSAKEAFYKCQFPVSRTFLGFEDVRLEVSDEGLSGELLKPAGPFRAGARLEGRWRRAGALFVTSFWLGAE